MGNASCIKSRKTIKPEELPPKQTLFKSPLSKSEHGFQTKKEAVKLSAKSFCHKLNFEDLTISDFKDSFMPYYGERAFDNELDRKYFSEEEKNFYHLNEPQNYIRKVKKTTRQKIRWSKGEVIGKGAFGVVFLGFNKGNGQLMAVKEFPLLKSFSKNEMITIANEIELLKELKHPNIVTFIGSQKSAKSIYLFFEYISGGNLNSLIGKYGKLNESLIARYCQQILEGLEYLHLKGVIHSDIKGPNIMVDKNGVCKLTDFGSAIKIYRNNNEMGKDLQVNGTANWMAPEVIKQEGYGRSADIWSFGCTVIEMLTGKLPWSNYENPYSIMFNVAKGTAILDLPPKTSPELKDFINKCLKRNPLERYNCYKLLRHPFLKRKSQSISI